MSKNGFVHHRRGFLQGILGGVAAAAFPTAAKSEASSSIGDFPTRVLGKTGVRVTTIGLGGARLPMLSDDEAVRMVDAAYDAGINFFDNARSYTDGRSERIYGRALQGKRKNVFLTSKTTERSRDGAERELDESLGHLKTDYLDLWQIHSVSTKQDVEQIFGPNGALEAFERAKKQGKARFIGFTGHHDPEVHMAMLERFDFDTILMPLHAADPHYLSFEESVLARAAEKNMGITAMKVTGNAMLLRAVTVDECLRYVLSLPVACAIMGFTTPGQLEDDLRVARGFTPLNDQEKSAILAKSQGVKGPALEYWKKNVEGSTASIEALEARIEG
jgi:aryl-alcohol dehydrogenase-like predicted oxidoreductase